MSGARLPEVSHCVFGTSFVCFFDQARHAEEKSWEAKVPLDSTGQPACTAVARRNVAKMLSEAGFLTCTANQAHVWRKIGTRCCARYDVQDIGAQPLFLEEPSAKGAVPGRKTAPSKPRTEARSSRRQTRCVRLAQAWCM